MILSEKADEMSTTHRPYVGETQLIRNRPGFLHSAQYLDYKLIGVEATRLRNETDRQRTQHQNCNHHEYSFNIHFTARETSVRTLSCNVSDFPLLASTGQGN